MLQGQGAAFLGAPRPARVAPFKCASRGQPAGALDGRAASFGPAAALGAAAWKQGAGLVARGFIKEVGRAMRAATFDQVGATQLQWGCQQRGNVFWVGATQVSWVWFQRREAPTRGAGVFFGGDQTRGNGSDAYQTAGRSDKARRRKVGVPMGCGAGWTREARSSTATAEHGTTPAQHSALHTCPTAPPARCGAGFAARGLGRAPSTGVLCPPCRCS